MNDDNECVLFFYRYLGNGFLSSRIGYCWQCTGMYKKSLTKNSLLKVYCIIKLFLQKLEKFVESHEKGKISYVNDIVLMEAKVPDSVAIDALLWLKR